MQLLQDGGPSHICPEGELGSCTAFQTLDTETPEAVETATTQSHRAVDPEFATTIEKVPPPCHDETTWTEADRQDAVLFVVTGAAVEVVVFGVVVVVVVVALVVDVVDVVALVVDVVDVVGFVVVVVVVVAFVVVVVVAAVAPQMADTTN